MAATFHSVLDEYVVRALEEREHCDFEALFEQGLTSVSCVPSCLRGCRGHDGVPARPKPIAAVGAYALHDGLVAAAWVEPCDQPGRARLGLLTTLQARSSGVVPRLLAEAAAAARRQGVQSLCASVVSASHCVVDDLMAAGLHISSALSFDGTTELTVDLDG